MEAFFTKDFMPLWVLILTLALFLPVRHLIWVLYMRRAARKAAPDESEQARLRRRAGVTSALLCVVFSFFYVSHLFRDAP